MQSQESESDHLTNLQIFNSKSDSSNVINKDSVLDQMEVKLGELLQTNQELYSIKNQNVTLKEKNIYLQTQLDQEKQMSKQIITQLKEENSEKSNLIAEMKEKLDEYSQKSAQLSSEKELLEQKIELMIQESEKDNQTKLNQHESELDSLKESLENKTNEVNELKKELEEMKSQNSSNSETIMQSRIENERLAAEKTSDQKENQILKETVAQLTEKLTTKKQKYQQMKEIQQQLKITNNKYENEIIKLKQKHQIYKERIADLDNNLQQAKTMIRQVLNCQAPRFKSIDDLIASHRQYIEENNELRAKMKSQEKTMKKFAFAIQKYEAKVTELNETVDNTKAHSTELQTKIDDQTKQIELLELKNQSKIRKLGILPVYEKVMENLNDKIYSIMEIVHPEESDMSIRTLLIFAIMLKRWKSLVGLRPKIYVNDSRNWWWMNSTERSKTIVADVDTLITSLNEDIEKYKATSKELQDNINQYQNNLQVAEQDSTKTAETIQLNNKKIAELQSQVQELQKLSKDQVPNTEHQNLIDKHAKTKMKLKDCRETIKEKDEEIKNLKTELAKTENELSSQYMKSKQKDRLLEDTKYQLYNAQNGISHLQNGYNMKTRELLSLERGIQKEQNNVVGYNAQNSILALENRRLNFQIAKQNRILTSSPPDHQYVENK